MKDLVTALIDSYVYKNTLSLLYGDAENRLE